MNKLNDKNHDNINIHVAFQVSSETSPAIADVRLRAIIKELFEESDFQQEFMSQNESGGEIIYQFQAPLLFSDTNNKDFFEKLDKIFEVADDMEPHFTQNNATEFTG